jgi:dephospho-CoA kinase
VFEAADEDTSTVIINRHEGEANHPAKLNGAAPVQIFRRDFNVEWEQSAGLESVIADRIFGEAGARQDILDSFDRISARLKLDHKTAEKIVPHLAFRDCCSVIFVVGQPGAGKSYVRRRLAARLTEMGIETRELTDYVYAYRDLLSAVLKLDPLRGAGFKAHEGGAFVARDEGALAPALRALALATSDSVRANEVTLVEFARADLVRALREFDEIRQRSRVIHVSGSEQVRLTRLSRRVVVPETSISDTAVRVELSDNHLLPSTAERTLYAGGDGISLLRASSFWRSRVFEIDNDVDGSERQLQEKVGEFIESIVAGYRPVAYLQAASVA